MYKINIYFWTQWPHGYCTQLHTKWSGFKLWQETHSGSGASVSTQVYNNNNDNDNNNNNNDDDDNDNDNDNNDSEKFFRMEWVTSEFNAGGNPVMD